MRNPNKLDFFVGSFISCIINAAKKVPILIDETDNSKRIKFTTDNGDYNIFFKYSTNIRCSTRKINGIAKEKITCDISFSKKEYEILKYNFFEEKISNLIVLVITNSDLNNTKIIAIPYDIAMECLITSDKNEIRRLSVTRIGRERTYNCYGIGNSEEFNNRVFCNWQKYFGEGIYQF